MTIEETSIIISEGVSETTALVTTLVAVHYENNKFGAAVFIDGELKIMSEDYDGIHRDFIDMISLNDSQIQFISSTHSNISALKQCLPLGANLQLVPSVDFTSCTADEINDEFLIEINYDNFSANESCFKSLRAILIHLTKTIQPDQIPRNISTLQIESTNVVISKSCLQALQIFDYEPHPNMHASHQGFKEGCSIYSLFNRTVSEEGRAKLKKWFHQPTNNIQTLKTRQDSIEVLMKSEMSVFAKSVTKSLKKCIRISVNTSFFQATGEYIISIFLECCY